MKALLDKGADANARLRFKVWYSGYNFDLSGVDEIGATAFWRAAYAVRHRGDEDCWWRTAPTRTSRPPSRPGGRASATPACATAATSRACRRCPWAVPA